MKKDTLILLFALLSFTLVFSSCNDDDEDENPNSEQLLLGRWTGETLTESGSFFGITIPEETTDISDVFVDFNSDGTYTSNDDNYLLPSGTWELTGGNRSILFDRGTEDEITASIINLTESDLQLEGNINAEEEGQTIIEAKIEYDFRK